MEPLTLTGCPSALSQFRTSVAVAMVPLDRQLGSQFEERDAPGAVAAQVALAGITAEQVTDGELPPAGRVAAAFMLGLAVVANRGAADAHDTGTRVMGQRWIWPDALPSS